MQRSLSLDLYETTTRIPLIIRHPEGLGAGQRTSAVVQPPDLLPTILEFLDVPVPATVQGKSLWPLITGEAKTLHEYAFSGRYPLGLAPPSRRGHWDTAHIHDGWAGPADNVESLTVTNEDWSLICGPRGRASELYDLVTDPEQSENVLAEHLETATAMQQALVRFMRELGAAPERIEPFRLGREARPRFKPDARLYVIGDDGGRLIGFPRMEDAEEKLGVDLGGFTPAPWTSGWLREQDPKALVHVFHQYYWAQDLG